MLSAFNYVAIAIVVSIATVMSQTIKQYNELYTHLLANYNKNTLPTNDLSKTFEVKIETTLLALGELDEVEEKLSTVMGFQFTWQDDTMVWNPDDYNGIVNITVSEGRTWIPFLSLLNLHHDKVPKTRDTDEEKVMYIHNGNAEWYQTSTLVTTCDLDTTKFPFDNQTCDIQLYVTGYEAYYIKTTPVYANETLDWFRNHGAWVINDKHIKGSHNSKFDITFYFNRKPMFMLLNVLLPIIFVSLLAPLVFLLPHDTGERAAFSITTLLNVSVYMIIICKTLPQNSQPMPLITIMLFVWYLSNASIVMVSTLNTRIHYMSNKKPVPRCLGIFTRRIWNPSAKAHASELVSNAHTEKNKNRKDCFGEPTMCFNRQRKVNQEEIRLQEAVAKDRTRVRKESDGKCHSIEEIVEADTEHSTKKEITWIDVSKAFDVFFIVFYYSGKLLFLIIVFSIIGHL